MPSKSIKLIEITRGDLTESTHCGHFVVCDQAGTVQISAGDAELITYPRSALKLIQAIELVESGAAQQFNLEPKHLAMACSSHRGELFHNKTISAWLTRIDCQAHDLACGPALPSDANTRQALLQQGDSKQTIYHTCSGKHTAMLTICRCRDYDIADYADFNHPVQQSYRQNLSLLTEQDADHYYWGIDGCALPAPALSLHAMAKASARLSQPKRLSAIKRNAVNTLFDAITQAPEYLSGSKQVATELAQITQGRIIAKYGAEGYYIAVVRDQGLGIALKIDDGAARAADVAILNILKKIGALQADELKQLSHLFEPRIYNSRGLKVGVIKSC